MKYNYYYYELVTASLRFQCACEEARMYIKILTPNRYILNDWIIHSRVLRVIVDLGCTLVKYPAIEIESEL